MDKDIDNRISFQNKDASQDSIMNRVNQSFDQIEQEVKDLLDKNKQEMNMKKS